MDLTGCRMRMVQVGAAGAANHDAAAAVDEGVSSRLTPTLKRCSQLEGLVLQLLLLLPGVDLKLLGRLLAAEGGISSMTAGRPLWAIKWPACCSCCAAASPGCACGSSRLRLGGCSSSWGGVARRWPSTAAGCLLVAGAAGRSRSVIFAGWRGPTVRRYTGRSDRFTPLAVTGSWTCRGGRPRAASSAAPWLATDAVRQQQAWGPSAATARQWNSSWRALSR